jgi:hypothetical protein
MSVMSTSGDIHSPSAFYLSYELVSKAELLKAQDELYTIAADTHAGKMSGMKESSTTRETPDMEMVSRLQQPSVLTTVSFLPRFLRPILSRTAQGTSSSMERPVNFLHTGVSWRRTQEAIKRMNGGCWLPSSQKRQRRWGRQEARMQHDG